MRPLPFKFKRSTIIITSCVAVLTVILVLTMVPLVLMFYTSIKTGGTLFQKVDQILIADFNRGATNSIGGPISTRYASPSWVKFEFLEDTAKGGRFAQIDFLKEQQGEAVFWTRLGQDMRKFSRLEFLVRGVEGNEYFQLGFADVRGRKTLLPISDYARDGVKDVWQKVVIPVKDFDFSLINPEFREKTAEDFLIAFNEPSSGGIQIDDVRLYFKSFTIDNYVDVLISGPFGRYFFNSSFIAIIVVGGNIIFSSMVGYAFARRDFPWKNFLFILILGSLMIPPQVFMVPVFILMKNLNWLNTYWALTLPTLVTPFNVFLMRQYISKLPSALEDAARIDGASDFQIFFKVIMPLCTPAIAVVGINTFMGTWNTFLYPFILTNTPQMRTLPVGLALYKSLQGVDWVHLMAGSGITAIPVIIVFLMFQRYIIAGLTAGSTKG